MNHRNIKTRMQKMLSVSKVISRIFIFALCCREGVAVAANASGTDNPVELEQQNALAAGPSSSSDPADDQSSVDSEYDARLEGAGIAPAKPKAPPAAPNPVGPDGALSAQSTDSLSDLPEPVTAKEVSKPALTSAPRVSEPTPDAPRVSITPAPVAAAEKEILSLYESQEEKAETPLIRGLLLEAEKAFKSGRLIEPSHDNAYDRYQSVLILDKNNKRAQSGLTEILRRYSLLVDDALSYSRLSRAETLINKLSQFYPGNPLVKKQKQALARVKRKAVSKAVVNTKKVGSSANISLPIAALSKRSEEILGLLSEVVVRLIESDESIMIYARSDAEGRWIYSQMKRLSGGYRIRGDIRISSNPRIAVLPPL